MADPDKLAESDHDIWLECAARQKISADAESDNRTRGLAALKFRWGEQWPQQARDERHTDGRPCLTVNHTDVACTRIENQLRQQRPRIKVHPVSDANVDQAKKINGLTREIETRSNASIAYDAGVSMAKDIGWGYWRIGSEYLYDSGDKTAGFNDQQLSIIPVFNPFSVYDDPSAVMPAGEDRNWCVIADDMPRQEYKRLYKGAENVEYTFTEAPGDFVLDWESKTHVRLAEYFRIYEKRDMLQLMSDGSIKLKSELKPNKPETMAILQALQLSVVDERPTTTRVVQWFKLNGRKIVDRRELKGKYIPLIKCIGNRLQIDGTVKRKGMIENLIDPAQMYNYWRTAQTERLALTPKAPWVSAEGQTEGHPEWNDANRKSYSVLVYKPVPGPDGVTPLPPPQRQNPAPVEAGFAEAVSGAEHDLMSVAGMPQENPEIASRVVGGNKYLQRRQGMQDLTHYQYYDNQTYSIMMTGVFLLDLIPHYYDTQRTQRIIGEDGVPQVITINDKSGEGPPQNDMTIGRYDVVMDTGPGYATKREEAAENMIELLGTPLGEVIVRTGSDVVLRNMDFNGADVLADRAMTTNPEAMDEAVKALPDQAKNIIGALQQQLQQKDQQIQQMGLEIKYKGDIEQMKDQGQTRRTLITTTAKAHDTETQSQTADRNSLRDFQGWLHEVAMLHENVKLQTDTQKDVAEIKVAGELLNSHVEAAHNERAADKALKAGETDRA